MTAHVCDERVACALCVERMGVNICVACVLCVDRMGVNICEAMCNKY